MSSEDLKALAAREAGDVSEVLNGTNGTNARARGPFNAKNKDKIEELLSLLAQGYSKESACVSVSLSRRTFYNWLQDFPDFEEQVTDAEHAAEGHILTELRGAIQRKDDTKALMWLLSKLRPDRYGDKKELEITTKTSDGLEEVKAMFEQTDDMIEDKSDDQGEPT